MTWSAVEPRSPMRMGVVTQIHVQRENPRERFADCRALVIGAGRSGASAAKLLVALGATVTVTDLKSASALGSVIHEIDGLGIELGLGEQGPELLRQIDLVVVSPGVPSDVPLLRAAHERSAVEVIGEFELAARFIDAPCAAISGTNGKSTTTMLLGAMANADGRRVFVGGNIGQPLSMALFPQASWELVVAEVSSFQLETIHTFHPRYAALLNVTPDHLDRYTDFDHYVAAKRRLFLNADREDVAVLNAADPVVRVISRELGCRIVWFSEEPSDGDAVWCDGADVVAQIGGTRERLWPVAAMHVPGRHLLQNALAATALARVIGLSPDAIERAIREFQGQAHCLERVAEKDGVQYINDSKGTNVDAVIKALESFDRPIVWIGGGLDKGGGFALLRPVLQQRVKRAILFGAARHTMADALSGATTLDQVPTLDDAMALAAASASDGEVVLFSPACSSFDQFQDYRERGERFRALVHGLR